MQFKLIILILTILFTVTYASTCCRCKCDIGDRYLHLYKCIAPGYSCGDACAGCGSGSSSVEKVYSVNSCSDCYKCCLPKEYSGNYTISINHENNSHDVSQKISKDIETVRDNKKINAVTQCCACKMSDSYKWWLEYRCPKVGTSCVDVCRPGYSHGAWYVDSCKDCIDTCENLFC